MNVLFISHSSQIGGAENALLNLLKELPKHEINCFVLFPEEGVLEKRIKDLNIKTEITPLKWWLSHSKQNKALDLLKFGYGAKARINTLIRYIKDNSIDAVVTNTLAVADGVLAARVAKIPHIWWIHEILSTHLNLYPPLGLNLFYSLVTFLSVSVVVPCESVRNELKKHLENPDVSIVVINYGLEVRPESKADSGEKSKTVITIGDVFETKGTATFVEAAGIVCKKITDAKFIVVGRINDKTYYEKLISRIQALGIENNFYFMGFKNDVYSYLDKSSVFVLPSVSDAFPVAILEAMNSGKPIVATESGGTAEMAINGKTGFLIPVNDSSAMAEKIILLLQDEVAASKMGKAGYQKLKEEFGIQKFGFEFATMLRSSFSLTRGERGSEWNIISGLVDVLDAVGGEYKNQIEHKEQEIEHKEQEIQRKEQEVQQKEQIIQQLLSSPSWKITAPLRWLKHKLLG